jgi:hypothetical protein
LRRSGALDQKNGNTAKRENSGVGAKREASIAALSTSSDAAVPQPSSIVVGTNMMRIDGGSESEVSGCESIGGSEAGDEARRE